MNTQLLSPLVVVGCTASGKSAISEALALLIEERFGTRALLLAVDSMQVYRGMDLGTAKPDSAAQSRFDYRMLDRVEPWESFSAARFAEEARPMLQEARQNGTPVILVGGTILYLRALLEGLFDGPSADAALRSRLLEKIETLGLAALHGQLAAVDPLAAQRIHPNDQRRIIRALEVFELTGRPISELQTQWNLEHPATAACFIGLQRDKDLQSRRINARVKIMMAQGLLEEVKKLAADERGFSQEAASAVGYRQLLDYLAGEMTLDEAVERIKIQSRHLAKLQRTWLRRYPQIHWLEAQESQSGAELAPAALEHWLAFEENSSQADHPGPV